MENPGRISSSRYPFLSPGPPFLFYSLFRLPRKVLDGPFMGEVRFIPAAEDWRIRSSLKRTGSTQGKDEAASSSILIAVPAWSPPLTTSIWHLAPELWEALNKVNPEMSRPAEWDSRKSIEKFWNFWT